MDQSDYVQLVEKYNRLKSEYERAKNIYTAREEENRVLKDTLKNRLKIS